MREAGQPIPTAALKRRKNGFAYTLSARPGRSYRYRLISRFADVGSAAVFAKYFKFYGSLPIIVFGRSAWAGRPTKSSRFERDPFTGCFCVLRRCLNRQPNHI